MGDDQADAVVPFIDQRVKLAARLAGVADGSSVDALAILHLKIAEIICNQKISSGRDGGSEHPCVLNIPHRKAFPSFRQQMRIELLWASFHDPDQTSRDLGDVLWLEAKATEHVFQSGEHFPGKDELHGSGLATHVENNSYER